MQSDDPSKDMKASLLSKSPSDKDFGAPAGQPVARVYELPCPRPTRGQFFVKYLLRMAAVFLPVYTFELVLLELRWTTDNAKSINDEIIFGANFLAPGLTSVLFAVMLVDDLAYEYQYYRLLEYGLLPRFERRPMYTAGVAYFIGLLGFGSAGVVGYFVNPRQGGLVGLQALQLLVMYYVSFWRADNMVTLSHFFGPSADVPDISPAQAMLAKFVPITERQLVALCVHKRNSYDKVRRGLCCPDVAYVRRTFKTAVGHMYGYGDLQRLLAANPGLPNTCVAQCNPLNRLWAYRSMVTTEIFLDPYDAQFSKFIFWLLWGSIAFVLAAQVTTGVMFALTHRPGIINC